MTGSRRQAVVRALKAAGAKVHGRYHLDPQKRLALTRYFYQTARKPIKSSRFLDVGCGDGIDCIAAGMLGACQAVGIDVDEIAIGHMRGVAQELETQGFNLNVKAVLHNVVDGLPFEDNSFDVVFLIEAVSHIVQLDGALQDVLRVTKPGGAVVINDSNNRLRKGIEKRTIEVWEQWENGPRPDAGQLPEHEHSYKASRRHMIKGKCPKLGEDELDRLAAATTGKYGQAIFDMIEDYLRTGCMPTTTYQRGTCPISPDGQYMERLLNPYDLARDLRRIGFSRAVVMAHLTHGNWFRAAVDRAFRLLPRRISMPLSRGFILVAYK